MEPVHYRRFPLEETWASCLTPGPEVLYTHATGSFRSGQSTPGATQQWKDKAAYPFPAVGILFIVVPGVCTVCNL